MATRTRAERHEWAMARANPERMQSIDATGPGTGNASQALVPLGVAPADGSIEVSVTVSYYAQGDFDAASGDAQRVHSVDTQGNDSPAPIQVPATPIQVPATPSLGSGWITAELDCRDLECSIVDSVEKLIVAEHAAGSWHHILNNHSSIMPKHAGGPMFKSLTALKIFWQESDTWICKIDMPCSFQAGDGRPLSVQVAAPTKNMADANACCRAFAMLLALDPSNVVLRPTHWKCSEAELVHRIAQLLQQEHQPLAVFPSRAAGSTKARQAVGGDLDASQDDSSMEILRILHKCLDVEGGECDPSRFRTHPDGLKPW